MLLITSNSHVRRIAIISTTSTLAAFGVAYLFWKIFFRRTQNQSSGRSIGHGTLIRAPSFDEWENAEDKIINEESLTPHQLYNHGLEHMNISVKFWQRSLNMIDDELKNQNNTQYEQKSLCELKQRVQFLLNKINASSITTGSISNFQQDEENECDFQSVPSSNSFIRDRFFSSNRYESNRAQQQIQTAISVQSDLNTLHDRRSLRSIRSNESFASCPDNADWIDSEDLIFDPSSPYYSLPSYYVYGLRLAEKNQVPYRKLRTKVLHCSSDTDYLAKLYCIRNACDEILSDNEKKNFLKRISKQICERLLQKASKNTMNFDEAFERMNNLLSDERHWKMVNEELTAAGIKSATVYNVAIDFMLLEGFEILDSPPSAMKTILQNRWLSESFREQALNKAVSYALKVRRATAKHADGFLTTFLSLIEDMAPLFAWGILGPDTIIKPMCTFLKDSVLDFARSLYDFKRTDYSSLTALTNDVDRQINDLLEKIAKEFEIDENLLNRPHPPTTVCFT